MYMRECGRRDVSNRRGGKKVRGGEQMHIGEE